MEAFVGFAQVRMRFLDDDAGLGEALGGFAGDGDDFRIDRRDTEITRVGDTPGLFPAARSRQERGRQFRQRQRIGRTLAAHGVEQQCEVFDIACHRALDAEIAVDRGCRRMRDAADAGPQADDAAEAGRVA